jgi:hypothetical protein
VNHCRSCGRKLQSRNTYGYCSNGAECRKLYNAERYRRNPQLWIDRSRKWEEDNPGANRERKRARRREHPDEVREQHRMWDREHGAGWWREVVDAFKVSRGCASCGFTSLRPGYFDLDHIDPSTKTTEVSQLVGQLSPRRPDHREQFLAEMAKCQVLCTACHREKSAAERQARYQQAT